MSVLCLIITDYHCSDDNDLNVAVLNGPVDITAVTSAMHDYIWNDLMTHSNNLDCMDTNTHQMPETPSTLMLC